jgi:hypothetical protein
MRPRLIPSHDSTNHDSPDTARTAEHSISNSLTTSSSSGDSLEPSSITTTSNSLYPTTSRKLRARIKHRIHDFVSSWHHRKTDPEAEAHPEISWPITPPTTKHDDKNLKPCLNALTLSHAEQDLLTRMNNAHHAALTNQEPHHQPISNQPFNLHLRGGGDGDNEAITTPFSGPRRRLGGGD